MPESSSFAPDLSWQTIAAPPVAVGDLTVIPQSQALTIRWHTATFIWHRPVAVLVQHAGHNEHIPIRDTTRLLQLSLLSLSLVLLILAWRNPIHP
jgi:uncharacterized metal-binding protein